MRYRELGRTGLNVSEIGMGTWGFGGSYGPVDDEESLNVLRYAFDKGVTFYDTSDLYGDGRSEAILGVAIEGRREDVIIATKGGMLPHTGFIMPQNFTVEFLQEALRKSLARLRTTYVDVYLLHSPTIEDLEENESVFAWLEKMKDAGCFRAHGVSARSPSDAMTILNRWKVDVLQVNFNLIDQRAVDTGLLTKARELGVGIIARTPLAFGYLSGTMTGRETLAPGDHRANWPVDQLQRWAQAPEKFAMMNKGRSRSMVQLALQYCISDPAVSTVIPGMASLAQVDEDVAASELGPLDATELILGARIYHENEFFDHGAKTRGAA